jgi:hypothetical protein
MNKRKEHKKPLSVMNILSTVVDDILDDADPVNLTRELQQLLALYEIALQLRTINENAHRLANRLDEMSSPFA